MVGLVGASVVLALLPLALILANLVVKGVGSLDWAFFTRMPAPTGQEGGGVAHAIVGTLLIVGAASLISLGSTCPSRPALGVNSHTTPLSW